MKDHISHDVLLLCLDCHLKSNSFDVMLRQQLAVECNAPIGSCDDVKVYYIEYQKFKIGWKSLHQH
jgi:hypothetical protein